MEPQGAASGEKGNELLAAARAGQYPGKRPTINTDHLPPASVESASQPAQREERALEKAKPLFRQLLDEVKGLRADIKQLRKDLFDA